MDSLLASYASSDEEQEEQTQKQTSRSASKPVESSFSSSTSKLSSLFSSLPPPKDAGKTSVSRTNGGGNGEDDVASSIWGNKPKSSSIFSSLPPPKQNPRSSIKEIADFDRENSSSISSSFPQPKSQISQKVGPVSDPVPKRVIQFKLPLNPRPSSLDDEDEDDEEEKDKERKKRRDMEASAHDSSVKSFLFKMPAPKNSSTLGVAPTSGSGRRSIIIETEAPASTPTESGIDQTVVNNDNYTNSEAGNHVNYQVENSSESYYANYGAYGGHDQSAGASVDASGYGGYDSGHGGYASYGDQYVNNWGNAVESSALPEAMEAMDGALKRGRRGKKEIVPEIVEVTQDQLMKNRPREDQVKSTGIAFGPAYQPASSKGKPTKLLKRKHQITSLYFDMKQKEAELSERRSRGFLTKSETQAKYGW